MLSDQKFSMKFVSNQTGLSSDVIRAWEKRYAAIQPERTETNRRLYSAVDIARLEKLALLTNAGHSIGRIAGFTDSQLQSLVSDISSSVLSNDKSPEDDNFKVIPVSRIEEAVKHAMVCMDNISLPDSVDVNSPVKKNDIDESDIQLHRLRHTSTYTANYFQTLRCR